MIKYLLVFLFALPAFSQVKLTKEEAALVADLRASTQISLAVKDSLQRINASLGDVLLSNKAGITLSKPEAKFVYDFIIVPRQEELMLVSVLRGKLVQGKPLDDRERRYILNQMSDLFVGADRIIELMRTIVKQDSSIVK